MSDNPFYRLAPFIQEYIYRHRWTELREIQVQACEVLFNSEAHLVLAAGTASGKTEAAFLPILTTLYENPPASVGARLAVPPEPLPLGPDEVESCPAAPPPRESIVPRAPPTVS